ncbi:hypothetical protein [Glaciimonas sp. PAMC28666]|uniref:hypothetical protein n=1 Tax=Glaciimonas sp. PAMC28666 TaxID=2807626 RepID=UPI001965B5B0|nr:hypothetical protein [Glaciimonas sp. PAMC28666]QRX81639.1 hypothetical protein JQN73_15980 [Glaciimonas sp. PAMC28666]
MRNRAGSTRAEYHLPRILFTIARDKISSINLSVIHKINLIGKIISFYFIESIEKKVAQSLLFNQIHRPEKTRMLASTRPILFYFFYSKKNGRGTYQWRPENGRPTAIFRP